MRKKIRFKANLDGEKVAKKISKDPSVIMRKKILFKNVILKNLS